MATCVVGMTADPNTGQPRPACNVHCTFTMPCTHDGEPASAVPLHGFAEPSLLNTMEFWMGRTGGQRPIVIHNGFFGEGEHLLSDDAPYPGCPCGAEIIEAVTA